MSQRHVVRPGECISSIAFDHGFFPDTLWRHPENAKLSRLRKDKNVLMPGDVVFVPDLRPREESAATDRRHCFRRKGVPERLRVQLLDGGKPRAHAAFEVDIDGTRSLGSTDGQGRVDLAIPPNSRTAIITLVATKESFHLRLGELDPLDETSGVQARLRNLGYYHGPVDGRLEVQTVEAILAFQIARGLELTGAIDEPMKQALAGAYERGEP